MALAKRRRTYEIRALQMGQVKHMVGYCDKEHQGHLTFLGLTLKLQVVE